jgi:hypothetical protein
VSATTATLPRFLLHLPHPVAAHRVPLPPDPTCQPRSVASPAPHRPPLSCNSAPTPARHYQPWRMAPLSLLLLPPRGTEPTPTLLLFPSPPRAPKRLQKPSAADLGAIPLHFSSPSAPRAADTQLTRPVRAVFRSPHRLATGSPSHRRLRFSVTLVRRSSVRRGSQLACASPSPFSSSTIGPRHRCHPSPERLRQRWTLPLRPRTSSCCSGEPSPPPPRQAHYHRPHSAHTAIPKTPCPPDHMDQPRHPAAARAPLPRRGPPPRLDRAARSWPSRLVGRHASHCSPGPVSAQYCAQVLKLFSICFK